MKTITAALLAATMLTGSAAAASITTNTGTCPDPKVGQCFYVYIKGKIEQGDERKFEAIAKNPHSSLPRVVSLSSDGGHMLAGFVIGVRLREWNYATLVSEKTRCASACADIWLAGIARFASESSAIGFHSPYMTDKKGRTTRAPADIIALNKRYYAQIGIPKPAADFFLTAAPEDMYWMNGSLLDGLRVEFATVEEKRAEFAKTQSIPDVTRVPKSQDRVPTATFTSDPELWAPPSWAPAKVNPSGGPG